MKTLFVFLVLVSSYQAHACQPPPPNALFARSVTEILKDPVVSQLMRSYQISAVQHSGKGRYAIVAGTCALNVEVIISRSGKGPCGGIPRFLVKPVGEVTCLP